MTAVLIVIFQYFIQGIRYWTGFPAAILCKCEYLRAGQMRLLSRSPSTLQLDARSVSPIGGHLCSTILLTISQLKRPKINPKSAERPRAQSFDNTYEYRFRFIYRAQRAVNCIQS